MTTQPNAGAVVSVIVPCRNEERYIAGCLDSILATDYPLHLLEVLVVDGRSEDRTRAILERYTERHNEVRVLDNPRRIQASALNLGIRAARGDILMRMDAHASYPRNYIPDLVAALLETGAESVGGTLITLPANRTAIGKAIATAMSHPFGVGNAHFRTGTSRARWVETAPFFCCRRETFERVGGFDESMASGEDSEFNARLSQQGGVLLVPHVMCYYYARGTLRQAASMYHRYGYAKPLVTKRLRRMMAVRQLAPPAFLLGLSATAVLSPWLGLAKVLFWATTLTYSVTVLGCSLAAGRGAGLRSVAALAVVFPVIHVSYGWGFLRSALRLVVLCHRGRGAHTPPSLRRGV